MGEMGLESVFWIVFKKIQVSDAWVVDAAFWEESELLCFVKMIRFFGINPWFLWRINESQGKQGAIPAINGCGRLLKLFTCFWGSTMLIPGFDCDSNGTALGTCWGDPCLI